MVATPLDTTQLTAAYRETRAELVARPGPTGPGRRRALTTLTDEWLAELFSMSKAADAALVAVGGYGRGELSPGSDLDLVLLHKGGNIAEAADRIWYPIWDSGVKLDHSVRTVAESRRMANADLWVLLGLLDARTIAGDDSLTKSLIGSVLGDWRALAASRVWDLRKSVDVRIERSGELAHLLEPDLKESYGGLRDITVLRAIAASWLTDVPHEALSTSASFLLDVRDSLHQSTGRPGDRLVLQEQEGIAQTLGVGGADALLRAVSTSARAVAYASDIAWHRVGRLTRSPRKSPLRRDIRRLGPERTPLADGVVVQDGEVVLSVDARPDRDPVLVLRAAAAAAQAGLPLAPHTAERLAAESAPMPVPWPDEAREALVSLLGAGRPTVAVWEALDQVGLITRLIPEWEAVRSAPQRNAVHTFTVDRHLVEAAVAASTRTRRVSRPDLLLVGALLHDIGKARGGDHTEVGMQLVADIAPHLGYDDKDTATLVSLVEHHLLLPDMATRRDLDDPATLDAVASAVNTRDLLDVLHALTESDAEATGPAAWSDWKESLIRELVKRTQARLEGTAPVLLPRLAEADRALASEEGVVVRLQIGAPTSTVTVVAPDRLGLLSTVAGVLSLHRLQVRAADTETLGDRAVTVWRVTPLYGDFPSEDLLSEDVRRALSGSLDVSARLARQDDGRPVPQPWVEFVPEASARWDVLEVRAHDMPALLHRVSGALSEAGISIQAARVATLGSEVVDVFYVSEPAGTSLTDERRAQARGAVFAALAPTTL